ncbi:beta strand repeat-containing protein, partial [Undibacterium fentianense]
VSLVGSNLIVPAGVSSFTVTVATINDTIVDSASPETLPLVVGGVTGNGGIIDDDQPTISTVVSGGNVVEGNNLTYTVSLTSGTTIASTYAYTLGGGTATATSDYNTAPTFSNGVSLVGSNLIVPAGVSSFTVTVGTVDDTILESATAETVPLVIAGVTGTGGIIDNDKPAVSTVEPGAPGVGDNNVVEGNNLTYTITLTGTTSNTSTYAYTLGGGTATATSDYNTTPTFSNGVSLVGSNLIVPAGVSSFTVTVATINDTIVDSASPETLPLVVGGVTGNGGIIDNDQPTISLVEPGAPGVGDNNVVEGANLIYSVTLSSTTTIASTYAYALGGGTASATSDYNTTPTFSNGVSLVGSNLIVPAGVSSFTVTVATIDDTILESATAETLPLVIGGITGAGGILDNEKPAVSTVEPGAPGVGDNNVVEGSDLVYTITLAGTTSNTSTYAYTLGGGTATATSDYATTPTFSNGVSLVGSNLIVPAGVSSFTITVATVDDTLLESSTAETLPLAVAGITGTGGILDNDKPTVISVEPGAAGTGDNNVVEGNNLVYTVSLSAATSNASTYAYTLGGGTATGTSDFNTTPTFSNGVSLVGGNLIVPVGVSTFTVTVATIDDTILDSAATETLPLVISGVTGAGGITDNEFAPVATSKAITITEDAASVITGGGSVSGATYRLGWADFGITDANAGDTLSVKILTAPTAGVLQFFNGISWVSAVGLTITQAQVVGNNLRFVPGANESGDSSFATPGVGNKFNDYANFTFQGVDNGGNLSNTGTLTIDVRPVVDTATLTVTNVTASTKFSTSWEATDAGIGLTQDQLNIDNSSTGVDQTILSGWTRIDTPDNYGAGSNRFEIWSTGDTMTSQSGTTPTVNAMTGNGTNWLELNNANSIVQTLGIERAVTTVAGRAYDLTFDYAGRNGYSNDFTFITVLVDGVKVASYSNISTQGSLNWQSLKFSFIGTGGSQNITIISDATQYEAGGRGAMIDDIVLTERQGVIAGNAGSGSLTQLSLATYVSATLADTDGSETLSYKFSSLPAGSTIVTDAHPSGIAAVGGVVTVPAIEFASAKLQMLASTVGDISIGVTATTTETGGTTFTSASQNLNFTVLNGMSTNGYSQVIGNGNPNTMNGTVDNDSMLGGAGNDSLAGGSGADILTGGTGSDTLTGGAGADTFKWALNDNGTTGAPAIDQITDFGNGSFASGGDRLDLRDLLVGESSATLDKFLHFNWDGANTTVYISTSGAFTAGNVVASNPTNVTSNDVQQIVIAGVNLTTGFTTDLQLINDLIAKGKIVTD